MIQHITELKKTEKGARAVITLLADLEGDGIAGDRTLEGNEEAMKSMDQVIRIDQLRNATRHEGKMADQKSVVNFRENARDKLAYWVADRRGGTWKRGAIREPDRHFCHHSPSGLGGLIMFPTPLKQLPLLIHSH